MYQISVKTLLKAGAHFGHPTSRWNPNFKPYLATKKNGIHIINLTETSKGFDKSPNCFFVIFSIMLISFFVC